MKTKKVKKNTRPFNSIPINPPKGYKEKETLPNRQFRVIPR